MKQFFGSIRGRTSGALLASVLMVAASLSLPAQTAPEQQGPPIIRSVEIQYVGPQTLSREKILSQMRAKPGQPYSESVVEQDIKALYRTGQVQNVRIFGQAEGDGVKVMVVLQTRSLVNEIEIESRSRLKSTARWTRTLCRRRGRKSSRVIRQKVSPTST
jgi:outer membrane protein assembly factor BamA